jgi:hypothetical protein
MAFPGLIVQVAETDRFHGPVLSPTRRLIRSVIGEVLDEDRGRTDADREIHSIHATST